MEYERKEKSIDTRIVDIYKKEETAKEFAKIYNAMNNGCKYYVDSYDVISD